MRLEEQFLSLQRVLDIFALIDVLLRSADHGNVAKAERVDLPIDDIDARCAIVHQIHLREHPNGPLTVWIDLPRQLQRVRVRNIIIGWRDSHDYRVFRLNVLQGHLLYLLLDVLGLLANGHLGQARQVNHQQIDHLGRVDHQMNRHLGNVLVVSADPLRVTLDFFADLVEVVVPLALLVRELRKFFWNVWGVEELNLYRSPGDNIVPSRQKVPADNSLEHTALSG